MGFRTFVDRDGHKWEIRPATRDRWELAPVDDNPGPARSVPPPGYEPDPYELSKEELQRLLDQSSVHRPRDVKNPFGDS